MLNVIAGLLGNGGAAGGGTSYESIATSTVGSGGVSAVTFSSIPSTFKHLQIRLIGKSGYTGGTGPDNFTMRFNGDTTGTNYYRHTVTGTGTGTTTLPGNDALIPACISTSGDNADVYGGIVIDILDYTNTNKNTTSRYLGGVDYNGADGHISLGSHLWMNTSAITTIELRPGNGWAQDSTFALYGIKG